MPAVVGGLQGTLLLSRAVLPQVAKRIQSAQG
jgi:hypothetical protein